MTEQKEEKKEEVQEERYVIVEVPVQTDFFIKDNQTGKIYETKALLLEVLNKLNKEVIKL